VPVYNGERSLSRALKSLLGQSFSDLELIVSDNASTDGTEAICKDFAGRDARVRYVRQESNIGAPRNWNFVVHEARGKFFKWASASDYCAPMMLEKCVNALEADPGIVACTGLTHLVDDDGQLMEVYTRDASIDEDSPSERFSHIRSQLWKNHFQAAVVRLDALRRTRLDRPYPHGDLVLTAELALYGRFKVIPEVFVFRHESRDTSTHMLTPIERQRIYDPKAKAPMKLLLARRHLDYLISIARAPIPSIEKARACRVALRLMRWDRGALWQEFRSLRTRTDTTE
jgi:glycosyltransferase involved in cell wall biosynthesis